MIEFSEDSSDGLQLQETVLSGSSVVVSFLGVKRRASKLGQKPPALQVAVSPDNAYGGTALVESTISSPEAIAAETALWEQWPDGTVAVDTFYTHDPIPVAIKCTAFGGNAELELSL